jgi:ketosteroid isomerase-like protein
VVEVMAALSLTTDLASAALATVGAAYAGFGSGDVVTLLDLFADDAVLEDHGVTCSRSAVTTAG